MSHRQAVFVSAIGANPAAGPAMIRTRFDKSAWTGGLDLVIGDVGNVSVDLAIAASSANR